MYQISYGKCEPVKWTVCCGKCNRMPLGYEIWPNEKLALQRMELHEHFLPSHANSITIEVVQV